MIGGTCSSLPISVGAPWAYEVMSTEESYESHSLSQTMSLVGFDSQAGGNPCCSTAYNGTVNHTVTLRYRGCIELPNGIVAKDAITLSTGDSSTGYAINYYIDDEKGIIGIDKGGGGGGKYVVDWEGDTRAEDEGCWDTKTAFPTYFADELGVYAEEHGVREPDQAHLYIPIGPNDYKIDQIKNGLKDVPSLMPIVGSPMSPGWMPGRYNGELPDISDEVLAAAIEASELTRVRASLLLSVLHSESGYQQYPGTGNYCKDLCSNSVTGSCPDCVSQCGNVGNPFCSYSAATQCTAFDRIWNKANVSGYSKSSIPLSSAGEYCPEGGCVTHCGGAMGPAQAMPSSWEMFDQDVEALTGNKNISPWNLRDAFVFAGLHLLNAHGASSECKGSGGAGTKSCFGESCSVWSYMGGHKEYAQTLVTKANAIADMLKGQGRLNEEWCTGWSQAGTGGGVISGGGGNVGGDWVIPVSDPLSGGFGGGHGGWDFLSGIGTQVSAANSGTVLRADCAKNDGYGCYVKIDHGVDSNGNMWETRYGHLGNPYSQDCYSMPERGGWCYAHTNCYDPAGLQTSAGSGVGSGQTVGNVNTTGCSQGYHLHFELRFNGKAVDPAMIFNAP